MMIPARDVKPGDTVVLPDGTEKHVYSAFTSGKKAKTTTLSKVNDPAPTHLDPDALVEVR